MSKKVAGRNFKAISRLKALVSVIETFNRTDAASLGKTSTGASWSNVRGSWGISSNKASSSDAASGYPLATLNFSKEDVTLTAKGVGPGVGTAFWVTDSNNWWGTYVDTEQTCQTCSTAGNCNAYGSVYSSGGNCATYGTQVTANNPTVGTTFCATSNPTYYATQVAANSTCVNYGTNYSGGTCANYGTNYSGGTCATNGVVGYSSGNCVYGVNSYSGGTCATNGVVGYTAGNTNYGANYTGGNAAGCLAYGSSGNPNYGSNAATTFCFASLSRNRSSVPTISMFTNKAMIASHTSNSKVYATVAMNLASRKRVRLMGLVSMIRRVPILASPEIISAATSAISKGTCTSRICSTI